MQEMPEWWNESNKISEKCGNKKSISINGHTVLEKYYNIIGRMIIIILINIDYWRF